MQEIRRIVVVALFLLLTFTAGCSDSNFSPSEKFIADNTLVGEIKENMTMKEVIQILGKGGYNTTGIVYMEKTKILRMLLTILQFVMDANCILRKM